MYEQAYTLHLGRDDRKSARGRVVLVMPAVRVIYQKRTVLQRRGEKKTPEAEVGTTRRRDDVFEAL